MELKDIVDFFVNLQTTKSKEESFLKGVLFGYGSYLACPTPMWELMKEYPHMIDIEKEMREMFDKIHQKDIADANRLLAEYQKKETP